MGYTFGDDNIIKLENFISGNSENWKKEIDTFKMIKGMLNSESCSVEEAYKLTVQLLSEWLYDYFKINIHLKVAPDTN